MGFSKSYHPVNPSHTIHLGLANHPVHTAIPYNITESSDKYPSNTTIHDLKNAVHNGFPQRFYKIDTPLIAIHRARYIEDPTGNTRIEEIGEPLESWRVVEDVIEEMFSDAAVGWKDPRAQLEEKEGETPRKMLTEDESTSDDDATLSSTFRPSSILGFSLGMGSSGSGKDKGRAKGRGKMRDLEAAGDVNADSEYDEVEVEAERRKRLWQRTKQRVVFVAVIPKV